MILHKCILASAPLGLLQLFGRKVRCLRLCQGPLGGHCVEGLVEIGHLTSLQQRAAIPKSLHGLQHNFGTALAPMILATYHSTRLQRVVQSMYQTELSASLHPAMHATERCAAWMCHDFISTVEGKMYKTGGSHSKTWLPRCKHSLVCTCMHDGYSPILNQPCHACYC